MMKNKHHLFLSLILFVATLAMNPAAAEVIKGQEIEPLPPGGVYRYKSENGGVVHSRTMSRDGVVSGYDVVDKHGRVLKRVPPLPTEEEIAELRRQKKKKEAAAKQKEKDSELIRMYSSSAGAEEAMNRRISEIEMKINYTRDEIQRAELKRDNETQKKAEFRRHNEKVPKKTTAAIKRYKKEMAELEQKVKGLEEDIADTEKQYQPIIKRLQVIADD